MATANQDGDLLRNEPAVLVVDDEDLVRKVAVAALSRAGYATISMSTGEETLKYLETDSHAVDCIVLDNRMPGLPGASVLQTIRQRWPTMPVVLCSGHARDIQIDESPWTSVLEKPYRIKELQDAVGALLDLAQ